ncbi:MAG: nitronate monooxygenase [Nocardioides sp.]|nr:nitronate monooxygenase [Nocardioides sp.]
MDLRDRIGLEHPVVQAGMGGGVAGGPLAGAVSAAGALGTVGIMAPGRFADALRDARRRAPGKPVAANLLTPFTRQAHVDACIGLGAALVVFHGGLPGRWLRPLQAAGSPVFATVGTAQEAQGALAAGVDGLVVQGLEAGGHLVGVEPLAAALPRVLDVAGDKVPVLAAGGVADSADVRRLLESGASAAVAGTRFLLTDESAAHPVYKERVLAADRTMVTMLFGVGWPMRHRVAPNAATERWCTRDDLDPRWVRRIARSTAIAGRVLPLSALDPLTARQRVNIPLFTPALPLAGMPAESVDRTALYAGETLHRIDAVIPAAEAVAGLAP